MDAVTLAGFKESDVLAARRSVKAYFTNKNFCKGGPIPAEYLESDLAAYIVLKTGCNIGPKMFHKMVEAHLAAGKKIDGLEVGDPIKRGLEYVRAAGECRDLGIAQEHSGGLVLLWLWLCKGVCFVVEKGTWRKNAAA